MKNHTTNPEEPKNKSTPTPVSSTQSPKTMKFSVIKTTDELKGLRYEWDSLLEDSHNNVVHLTHDWIMAWWDSFNQDKSLHIIVIRSNDNQLLSIAPLVLSSCTYRGISVRKISLMANGQSPSSDIIIRNNYHQLIINALLKYLNTLTYWDIIELNKLHNKSLTAETVLKNFTANKTLYGIRKNTESPFIEIDNDWEAFFKNKSTKFKKSIRNKINRIKRVGDISIERIQINKASDPAVEAMVGVSSNSWKKEIGNDMLTNPRINNFYNCICDSTGKKGYIMLWFLKKGDQPIAFEFHINYNGVVYPIRADYDKAYSKLSPGSVLEYNIIKTLFDEGVYREYNTCGHAYQYLVNWSSNTKQHINFEIFKKNSKSYALYLLEYQIIPILRRLRVHKILKCLKQRGK